MVRHDDIHTKLVRARDWPNISNAGIYGNDEFHFALFRELFNTVTIHPVSFVVTMRNIIFKIRPNLCEKVVHEDAARNAVAVVVAPDGNSLSGQNGISKASRRLRHVGHQKWVIEVRVVGRVEKLFRIFFCQDIAPREQSGGEVVICRKLRTQYFI